MITEIPSADEFINTGLSHLNFSWNIVATLLTQLDDSEYFGVDIPEVSNAFWEASKQNLSTALSITQQGVEFILKGRITEISPFLLITGIPRDWPKACDKTDTVYSNFKTIDAQDLIRVYNTVKDDRLSDEFVKTFNDLREKRNAIMHTVDRKLTFHAGEVVGEILSVYKLLFPNDSWVNIRREFLEKSPLAELHSTDFVEPQVIWEFSLINDLLSKSQMFSFFGLDKEPRKYICPNCYNTCKDSEIMSRTALLHPNTPESTTLYCFVCDEPLQVIRENCEEEDCKGNVISEDYGICTTCGSAIG